MKEIDKYMMSSYKETMAVTLEQLIKYSFPKIKDLSISSSNDGSFIIHFSEGIYSKEEVEAKINEVKNYSIKCNKKLSSNLKSNIP